MKDGVPQMKPGPSSAPTSYDAHAAPEAHAVLHAPPAQQAQPAGGACLFDLLPEGVLQLVYSHLSNRDRCSVRAACKKGATALHGVQEATLRAAQPAAHGAHAHATLDPRPLVVLAQRITALRHAAPHLTSLTLDLTPVLDSPGAMSREHAQSMLAACTGLGSLVVRGGQAGATTWQVVVAFGSSQAPCADAVLDVQLLLTESTAQLQHAVQNGWRVRRIEGLLSYYSGLPASVWQGVEQACVFADDVRQQAHGSLAISMDNEDDFEEEQITRLAEGLGAVQHVGLRTGCFLNWPTHFNRLICVATHVICQPALFNAQGSMFDVAVTAGPAPRLRGVACRVDEVPRFPPTLAHSLQELTVLLPSSQAFDQLLAWPPAWLPSLHTLKLSATCPASSAAGPQACTLRAPHVSALAAAAPGLRVLGASCVVASPGVITALQAELPGLQQCELAEHEVVEEGP